MTSLSLAAASERAHGTHFGARVALAFLGLAATACTPDASAAETPEPSPEVEQPVGSADTLSTASKRSVNTELNNEDDPEGCEDKGDTAYCSWPQIIVGEIHPQGDFAVPESAVLEIEFVTKSGSIERGTPFDCPHNDAGFPCHYGLTLPTQINEGELRVTLGGHADSAPLTVDVPGMCAVDITFIPVFVLENEVRIGAPRLVNPCSRH